MTNIVIIIIPQFAKRITLKMLLNVILLKYLSTEHSSIHIFTNFHAD
jgi:hypothetical protein